MLSNPSEIFVDPPQCMIGKQCRPQADQTHSVASHLDLHLLLKASLPQCLGLVAKYVIYIREYSFVFCFVFSRNDSHSRQCFLTLGMLGKKNQQTKC